MGRNRLSHVRSYRTRCTILYLATAAWRGIGMTCGFGSIEPHLPPLRGGGQTHFHCSLGLTASPLPPVASWQREVAAWHDRKRPSHTAIARQGDHEQPRFLVFYLYSFLLRGTTHAARGYLGGCGFSRHLPTRCTNSLAIVETAREREREISPSTTYMHGAFACTTAGAQDEDQLSPPPRAKEPLISRHRSFETPIAWRGKRRRVWSGCR